MSGPGKLLLAALVCAVALGAPPAVNPDAALVQDFHTRLDNYMKLRKPLVAKLKPTNSQAVIVERQRNLAADLRAARPEARQGDIFTPSISAEFRRLIGIAMQGSHARRVNQSLKHAEPVRLHLRVNDAYPTRVPLQSTPPTLLANLPPLPQQIDYRLIAHDLVLHDAEANIIVDFIPNAIP
ncbi:MAG TPA: hypothetical protein DEQ47_19565 [Solibacterales bacterium]|nr:hypothetical protein [Bryobacterales bacterium]